MSSSNLKVRTARSSFHIFSVSGCSLETTWDEGRREHSGGKKKLKRGYCESYNLISMTIKSRTLSSSGHTWTLSAAFSILLSCQPKFKVSLIFLTSNVELLSERWKVAKLLKQSVSVKVIQRVHWSPFNKSDHSSATYWLQPVFEQRICPLKIYIF